MTMMVGCSNEDVPVEEDLPGATHNLEGIWACIRTTDTDLVPKGFAMRLVKTEKGYIVSQTHGNSSLFKKGVNIKQEKGVYINIDGNQFIYTELPPDKFSMTKDGNLEFIFIKTT